MTKPILMILCLFGCLLTGAASAQEQSQTIPFPLPTREERLIEEATNPRTPLALAPLLSDANSNVRLVATRATGERGEVEVIKVLEELQNTAADAQLKAAIQVAITRLRTSGQTPEEQANQLKTLLASPDNALQLETILALQQINAPAAVEALLQYAQVSNNFYNKARALRALAEKGEARAVPLLAEFDRVLFSTDPNIVIGGVGQARMTREDIDRLGEMYWRLRFEPLTVEERMTLFEQELASGRVVGGLRMRDAVARMGEEVFPYLRRFAADKTKTRAVRRWSIELLGMMRDEEAPGVLEVVAREEALDEILVSAVRSARLSAGGTNDVVETIVKTLHQHQGKETIHNYKIVTPAISRLASLEKEGVDKNLLEDAVLPYLQNGSSTAANVVRDFGGEKSVEPLIQMVKNPQGMDEMIRQMVKHTALTSLGYIGARIPDPEGKLTLFLVSMTYDKNPLTRIVAVQALARAAGPGAIPVLLDRAKQEKDGAVLRFEISGIYKAGGAGAVEALQTLQKLATEKNNAWMLELAEEGLLRLEREKRTGKA